MEMIGFEPMLELQIDLQSTALNHSATFPLGMVWLEHTTFYSQNRYATNYATSRIEKI